MIRKWILASLASAVMAAGMVGCGEEPAAPVDKKAKAKTSTEVARLCIVSAECVCRQTRQRQE